MADLNDTQIRNWMLQQNISTTLTSSPDCLAKLQERPKPSVCNMQVGEIVHCSSDESGQLYFRMVPSPLNPHFELAIKFRIPAEKDAKGKVTQPEYYLSALALFRASDTSDPKSLPARTPINYTGRIDRAYTPPPDGGKDGITFSNQLKSVQFRDHTDVKGKPNEGAIEELSYEADDGSYLPNQHWISWRTDGPLMIGEHLDISRSSEKHRESFAKFISMMRKAQAGRTLHVVTKWCPSLRNASWPYFASTPFPVPPSYSLWLQERGAPKIMIFPPNRPFERDQGLVDLILGKLGADFYKYKTTVADMVKKLKGDNKFELAKLHPSTYFIDPRHYLAVVVGCYGYETLHGTQTVNQYYSGEHRCEMLCQNDSEGKKYLLLLNLHAPSSDGKDPVNEVALPTANEAVTIRWQISGTQHMLTGRVIPIPPDFLKYGRNVAVTAKPSSATPQAGHIDEGWSKQVASFIFGQASDSTSQTIERISALMTDKIETSSSIKPAFLKQILLGHDNSLADGDETKIPPHRKMTIDEVCKERTLNEEQIQAVQHYFTHPLTLVRGPPGSGKSKLVETILELEKRFRTRYWDCTTADAACDDSPRAILLDNAARRLEADALSPIIEGLRRGDLARILLAAPSERPGAAKSVLGVWRSLSLFERLVKTGYNVINLTKQYRMHSSISLVCRDAIYAPLRGIEDGSGVDTQPGVKKFHQWAKELFELNGRERKPLPANTNAINIIPVEAPGFPLKTSKLPGSTSRYSMNTARVIVRLVQDLLLHSSFFKPEDIMVIAFYKDQVRLLQAIFQTIPRTKDEVVVQTVDESQGSQRPVVIVDTVTQGPAANDALGIINADKRRFNVAMSRARVGRIVIAHKDMQKGKRSEGNWGKGAPMGPWTPFFEKSEKMEAKSLNGITTEEFNRAFEDVIKAWGARDIGN